MKLRRLLTMATPSANDAVVMMPIAASAPITDYHDLRILFAAEQGWDAATTLRHEMIHAMQQKLGGVYLPTWITEGSAVYLSNPPAAERANRLAEGRAALAAGGGIPGDKTFYEGDDAVVGRHYDTAYALISYLGDRYGRTGLIRRLTSLARDDIDAARFAGPKLAARARQAAR